MIAYAKRYQRGFETTGEALAVDVTRSVGIAGSFLDTMHTAEHFREELWMPKVLCRDRRAVWAERGSKSLDERAEEVATELMANEVDSRLSEDQKKELRRLADAFVARVRQG